MLIMTSSSGSCWNSKFPNILSRYFKGNVSHMDLNLFDVSKYIYIYIKVIHPFIHLFIFNKCFNSITDAVGSEFIPGPHLEQDVKGPCTHTYANSPPLMCLVVEETILPGGNPLVHTENIPHRQQPVLRIELETLEL